MHFVTFNFWTYLFLTYTKYVCFIFILFLHCYLAMANTSHMLSYTIYNEDVGCPMGDIFLQYILLIINMYLLMTLAVHYRSFYRTY